MDLVEAQRLLDAIRAGNVEGYSPTLPVQIIPRSRPNQYVVTAWTKPSKPTTPPRESVLWHTPEGLNNG